MDYEILGSILKDARSKLKITQSEIASKLGVTFQNVSSWERGKSKIDIDTLLIMCEIYGINFVSVLTRANKKSSTPAKAEAEDLSTDEKDLLNDYRQLNPDGQQVALDYMDGLTYNPKYKKCDQCKNMDADA